MPLANNSTGAGTGDNYSPTNAAMVAGILSPTDGAVYIYGYDESRQQVIIREVKKTAQVPHKGMTAHPVYTNNLLSTYVKNTVVPRTVGATHTPQAVLPTINDLLSTYVKNAVTPVAGKFGEMGSDGKYVTNRTLALRAERIANFKPVGALHGKAGINTRESYNGQDNLLAFTAARLKAIADNPVTGSRTHALHGVAGSNVRGSFDGKDGLLPLTMQRLNALNDNPVTGSFTHALHGRAGSNVRQSFNGIDGLLPLTIQRLEGLSNPVTGSWTHALYGVTKDMLSGYKKHAVRPTVNDFLSTYVKNPVTPTINTFLATYIKYAVNPIAGANPRESFEGNGSLLPLTMQRLNALKDNPVTGSFTHALHGRAGAGSRESFAQLNTSTGTTTTYNNLLSPTTRRLKALRENPVLGSHTHNLHGRAGIGGLGGFTFTSGKFKTNHTKLIEDIRAGASIKPLGVHGKSGIGGLGGLTFSNGKFKTDRTKQIEDAKLTMKPLGAMYGRAGIGGAIVNGRFETTNTTQFRQLRKMSSLKPVGAHGRPGTAGSIWAKTGKFATIYTQTKSIMTKLGGGGVSGAMSAAGGLVSGLADTMKKMLFGGSTWPIAKYYFYVLVGGTELGFQSVEGLEGEVGVIEYRDGNSPFMGKEKVPGLITYSKVTLKKGMFSGDNNGSNWFKELAQDRSYTKRRQIIIALLDHNHIPQFVWRYEKCFITKFTPANLDAESESEVAVEEMEFVGRAFYTETLIGFGGALASSAMNMF
jgi:phage tail-like protein